MDSEIESKAAMESPASPPTVGRTKKTESVSEMAARSRKINEMRVEFSEKLKTVESDLIQKISEQFAKRKGEYFKQFEMLYAEQLESDLNRRSGAVYDRLIQVVKEEIEQQMETRQGEFYESFLCDARLVVLREQEEQGNNDQLRIAELEHSFYRKYERVVNDSKAKLSAYQDQLRAETEQLLLQQVRKSTLEINRQLKDTNDDWLTRWNDRESTWNSQWLEREEQFSRREASLVEELEERNAELLHQIQEKMEQERSDIRNNFSEINTKNHQRVEETIEESIRTRDDEAIKYSKALEEQLESTKRQLLRLQKIHARELRERDDLQRKENETHQMMIQKLEALHDKSISSSKSQFESQQLEFERRLKRQFEDLCAKFTAKSESAFGAKVEESVRSLDVVAEIEDAKQEYAKQALTVAHKAAMNQFKEKFEEAKTRWKVAEEKRIEEVRSEVVQSFTLELKRLESELELQRKLNRDNQKSWMIRFHELQERQLKALKEQGEASATLMCERLDAYETQNAKMTRKYQEELLKNNDIIVQLRTELELKVARMKSSARQWAVDHAQALEAKYKGKITGVERHYLSQLENLQSKFCEHLDKSLEENVERSRMLVDERKARFEEIGDELQKDSKKLLGKCDMIEMEESMNLAKQRLVRLWESLDIQTEECTPFLTKLFAHSTYSPGILKLVNTECERISSRVPIFKMNLEREQLMRKVKCIHQFSDNPRQLHKLGVSIPASLSPLEFRDTLMARLALVTKELKGALQDFERTYQEKVLMHNVPLGEILVRDSKLVTESTLAVGAVTTRPIVS